MYHTNRWYHHGTDMCTTCNTISTTTRNTSTQAGATTRGGKLVSVVSIEETTCTTPCTMVHTNVLPGTRVVRYVRTRTMVRVPWYLGGTRERTWYLGTYVRTRVVPWYVRRRVLCPPVYLIRYCNTMVPVVRVLEYHGTYVYVHVYHGTTTVHDAIVPWYTCTMVRPE